MLKSSASAGAAQRSAMAAAVDFSWVECFMFPRCDALLARDDCLVAAVCDAHAEDFLRHFGEIGDVVGLERAADFQLCGAGVDDEFFAVVAVELGGCFGERGTLEDEQALTPGQIGGKHGDRLLLR